jgi:hypothetical protein
MWKMLLIFLLLSVDLNSQVAAKADVKMAGQWKTLFAPRALFRHVDTPERELGVGRQPLDTDHPLTCRDALLDCQYCFGCE